MEAGWQVGLESSGNSRRDTDTAGARLTLYHPRASLHGFYAFKRVVNLLLCQPPGLPKADVPRVGRKLPTLNSNPIMNPHSVDYYKS